MTDVIPRRGALAYGRLAAIFLAGALSAWLLGGPAASPPEAASGPPTVANGARWTCSMHPQFQLPKPGKCPICFMDLIALEAQAEGNSPVLELSAATMALAEVETTPVLRRILEFELRFVGRVDTDETRVRTITAWVPGRIERIFVDYTGIAVRKGDHLVELYSPDLISAQEEYLQALRAVREFAASGSPLLKGSSQETAQAAREKLRLLGVTEPQIAALERSQKVLDRLTIFAPAGGIVMEKAAIEGLYVQTGTPIYRIADLSVVWVNLEAYETDIAWLRYGQGVRFETEAYPGEAFEGRISFIDPILDTRTRTVRVRVNVPNKDGRLKPGMFVRAKVRARIAEGGRVLDETLAGKWISPMHPEVIKDGPGSCDVCGMPLVRAESLGLAGPEQMVREPLIIPNSAILQTGRRALVYVKVAGAKRPSFEGRVITLGPRSDEFSIVREGLEEGEEVVRHGAFKIDSALQIQARPSFMSADGKAWEAVRGPPAASPVAGLPRLDGPAAAALRPAFHQVLDLAIVLGERLAADDPVGAQERADALNKSLISATPAFAKHDALARLVAELKTSAATISESPALKEQRASYSTLSLSLLLMLEAIGSEHALQEVACPMAFGGLGARWVQANEAIRNPYFGASMLRCGSVVRVFEKNP